MTEQQITDFDRWFEQFMDPELSLTPGDKEMCRHAWQAALSHAEGEAVPVAEITIDRHGDAHFKACPNYLDLDQGTYQLYTHPAPQVAGLTETAIKSSPAYRALHREKEHLLGLLKERAPQVAVPECCRSQPCKRPGTGPCDMPAAQQPVSDPDGLPSKKSVVQALSFLRSAVVGAQEWDNATDDAYEMVKAAALSTPAPDEREIAALREDAERYRFWREVLAGDEKAAMDLFEEELNRDVAIGNRPPTGEELDKAVDVARRLRAGKEGE